MAKELRSRLIFELELLTPGFIGGANLITPVAAPSGLKGALRFWYRAVAPQALDRKGSRFEGRLFGSTSGQAPFSLRLVSQDAKPYSVPALESQIEGYNQGHGRNTRNGVRYLGYSLFLGDNKRRQALVPGSRLRFEARFPRGGSELHYQALLGSLWLLGHFGALGSRSRRGFGAVQLTGWEGEGSETLQRLLDQLPLLHQAAGPIPWRNQLEKGVERLGQWFGNNWQSPVYHPHLGRASQYWLGLQGSGQWHRVLNELGRSLQEFRLRREPDYSDIKARLAHGRPLSHAPERAAFGLPLTFRFRATGKKTARFGAAIGRETFHRWPSLLLLRPARLGNRLHPLVLRLDGLVPGQVASPAVLFQAGRGILLEPTQENLLDVYMETLGGARPWMP